MKDFYCVVTFNTTQQSLVFEKTLKKEGLSVKLMPVPRQVSSSCGIAAKVDCEKKEDILSLCKEKRLEIDDFHKIIKNKKSNWFANRIKNKRD